MTDYRIAGTLERSDGRWAIKTQNGRLIQITCGEVIEVLVAGHWICSRMEHDGRDYVLMEPIKIHHGMVARQR